MDVTLLVARSLLLAVFALAGLTKLANLAEFRRSLADFSIFSPFIPALSIVIPFMELAIAMAMVPRSTAPWAATAGLALLAAFSTVVGVNLARGRMPNCRCFGQINSAPISWRTLRRNLMLTGLALFVVWQGWADPGPSAIAWLERLSTGETVALVVAIMALVAVLLESWLLLHLLRRYGEFLSRIRPSEASEWPHGLPVGTRAPAFSLSDLSGAAVALDQLRLTGKPLALVFVNPACPSCPGLFPTLSDWQRNHLEALITVVVAAGERHAVEEMAAKYGLTHVLLDRGHETLELYQAGGIPSAVIIQPDGTIGSAPAIGPERIRRLIHDHIGGSPCL